MSLARKQGENYRSLWISMINIHMDDAFGIHFSLIKSFQEINKTGASFKETIEQQYKNKRETFLNKNLRLTKRDVPIETFDARLWFEGDAHPPEGAITFDYVCDIIGYDEGFKMGIFNTVQYAITHEKKLYDEFKSQGELNV